MPQHDSLDADAMPADASILSSSPTANPYPSPTRRSCRKERRNPSVTPRRLGRFFTPRSTVPVPCRIVLGTLGASATNRQPISPQSPAVPSSSTDPPCPSSPTEGRSRAGEDKKRRRLIDRERLSQKRRRVSSPDGLGPPRLRLLARSPITCQDQNDSTKGVQPELDVPEGIENSRRTTLSHFFKASRSGSSTPSKENPCTPPIEQSSRSRINAIPEDYNPRHIRKLQIRGFGARLLDREHGLVVREGKHRLHYPAGDVRSETASFYSGSNDVHHCSAYQGQGMTIPFSLSSCSQSPVTAIGDEQGFVRLFNTGETTISLAGHPGSKIDAHIRVHDNAIMDMDFSSDDSRLATACGDRSGKIVDVATQTVAVDLLDGHWDSLRKIAFQPGSSNGDVLATSDRAGRVRMWDLRCAPRPVHCFTSAGLFGARSRDTTLEPVRAKSANTIDNAHERLVQGNKTPVSVTAVRWLPAGREHLILTASEANACIKLWDTRYIKPRRQLRDQPLSTTPQPPAHAWRSYGITSLALNGSASLLYAVCKDSTIYAYSTAHLILGQAPELEQRAAKRRPGDAQGLGPIYGFKHPSFLASSFYVKCAIRPASAHGSEMLAVGSSHKCAVLFPTDERYMRAAWARQAHESAAAAADAAVAASGEKGGRGSASSIPIFRSGTALVRGHTREVTSASWSHEGKLVTASDDYGVRQWQTDARRARHLRRVGEFGGERHMAGWADAGEDWDRCDDGDGDGDGDGDDEDHDHDHEDD